MSSLPDALVYFQTQLVEAIEREHASRRRRRRRSLAGIVAAALIVVGTAAAFGTVRDAPLRQRAAPRRLRVVIRRAAHRFRHVPVLF
jgi:hypothetical protein